MALQPRETENDEQGDDLRAAVVLAAQHYSGKALLTINPQKRRFPNPLARESELRVISRAIVETRFFRWNLAIHNGHVLYFEARSAGIQPSGNDLALCCTGLMFTSFVADMAHVVMARSNTGALLIAHNGLAKLLSARLPWLIGGVLNAPRLLSQLSRICCDGLDQASFFAF